MNLTTALAAITKYLPAVLTGVTAIESVVHSEAPGTAKKTILLDAIQAASKIGEAVPEADVATISTLTDVIVGSFNATGYFQKKPAPAPAQ